jgi:hypothetical protein
MKRVIALAALLVAASACTTTTDNTNTGNANAPANANAAASPTPSGVTQADLEAKEHQVWDAIKAKNWDAFGGMLSDDFTIVGSDGVHSKADTLNDMKKYELTDYTFSNVKFVKVDDDLAVLVYDSTEKSTYDGKPTPADAVSHSASAWANRGGKWVAVYHGETTAMKPPASQGGNTNANTSPGAANSNKPAANSNANASASPAASPAAPSSATDAEKAVWDALKSKNYDGFANFLATDSMEIEPDGVYAKSQSVEGVKNLDASKYTLSDFKEVKIDSDSTLVTYTVKGPGMDGKPMTMYHSTVWSNRGGQWKAYLHQGTVAAKGGM